MRFLATLAVTALAVLSLTACPSDDDNTPPPDAMSAKADAKPAGRCLGVPDSCFTKTSVLSCRRELGCTARDESCSGVASSCSSQRSSLSCSDIDGCSWSFSSSKCTGIATSCSIITLDSECRRQGCTWHNVECSGVGLECSSFSTAFTCTDQPGCRWSE